MTEDQWALVLAWMRFDFEQRASIDHNRYLAARMGFAEALTKAEAIQQGRFPCEHDWQSWSDNFVGTIRVTCRKCGAQHPGK